MATEVIMPKVDMVMETGTIVEWFKKEGEQVTKGDALFVISTDKAAIEVEATADGILANVTARPDDVIPVTEVIAHILAPGEALPAQQKPGPVVTVAAPPSASAVESVDLAAISAGFCDSEKVRATPLARRIAQDLGIELAQLSGRGPRGRIHKADVLEFQQLVPAARSNHAEAAVPAAVRTPPPVQAPVAAPLGPLTPGLSAQTAVVPLPDARRKQVIPLAGARKIIAERLAHSAFTAPHINLSLRVDMTEVIRLRERVLEPIKAQTGQRVSYTAILARAVATVLPRHPAMNASLSDGNIILWEDIHLGIATNVEESLIVPVIRDVHNRSLGQMVAALADLTERARSRRLAPAEMSGSTFTITNLGMYGIESFTAIINPPESAILAVGKMVDTPVRSGDGFVFQPMIQLTACADHRIVDGAVVARFLDELKSTLENPYLLI
jgi:pyruvate dehydrogenase E2 component (dihydrolipoamide acetyltransferase)